MRRLIADEAHQHIATSVIARACKPIAGPDRTRAVRPGTSTLVQNLDDIGTAVETEGLTVRTLKQVDDVELTVKDIEPGHTTQFHSHPHAHQGIIMTGTGTLQLTGRRLPLAPGDVFSIAPNEPHAIDSEGPGALRLVCLDCLTESAT
jgi:quercetin dioxygenase-like cupin family protein